MNGKKVMLTIQGEKKEYPAGTSFLRIAQDYSDAYQDDIVLVLYNRRLRELNKCADGDGTVEFLTTADKTGKKAYRRSVTLLMQKAVYNLWGKGNISVRVKYSIGQGNYCELVKWENDTEEVVKVTGTEINKLKNVHFFFYKQNSTFTAKSIIRFTLHPTFRTYHSFNHMFSPFS